ncbi:MULTISPECIES: YaiO family outer membrane beta-barrel protein [Gammaproteobacteria]|uniref:YaiO family outer membrane beta-barrel protein n=1 Tax=Gammaproteobacteria TaxID=1236 RepID=UPI000DD06256|nr:MULTISPECIES: YaiO family outer membrane beta-barrel protein [Gammaproteobacteria]RTE85805.1 YaiO family outer membrane beta-barrel protein [Aliidiomarina sp. B3213]TCZ90193.1 YaiO family outer membrane beta-barrel protein [Lysobacter sp. N42]
MLRISLLLTLLCAPLAHAETQPSFVAAGIGFDTLSNNYDGWQHQYARGQYGYSSQLALRAEARNYQRFNLTNTEFSLGASYQWQPKTSFDMEIGTTPNADFRPEQRARFQVYQSIGRSWGSAVGIDWQAWPTRNITTLFIEPDWYIGNYRLAFKLSQINPQGLDSELGQQVSIARYYRNISFITLALATGREVEAIGSQVIVAEVKSLALYGRHEWRGNWSWEYALSWSEQGDFYDRQGVEIGLHYRF